MNNTFVIGNCSKHSFRQSRVLLQRKSFAFSRQMRARCFSDGRRTWSRVSSQDIRDKNLRELSIVDYQSLLHDRVANTQELIRAHLDVAKEQQQRCNFFTPQSLSSPECERIMQEAKQADDMRLFASTDERLSRPLHGVPIAVKQNICQRDKETSAGSAMLHSFISPYDATVVQRLRLSLIHI